MMSHNMTLCKICVLYQFHHWTLPMMKIDWDQIQFRQYVSTGTESNVRGDNVTALMSASASASAFVAGTNTLNLTLARTFKQLKMSFHISYVYSL